MFEKFKSIFIFKNTKAQKMMFLGIWIVFLAILFISLFNSFNNKTLLIILYVVTWVINLGLALLASRNHT